MTANPRLRCVSCNPTGARPDGVFDPGATGEAAAESELPLLVDSPGCGKTAGSRGRCPAGRSWTTSMPSMSRAT